MTSLWVRQKVTDFADWKDLNESYSQAQQAAGLGVDRVLRSIDDPSEVFPEVIPT